MTLANVSARAYQNLSSGLRINSAADDAAGLNIAQGMTSEINGMEKNIDNIDAMDNLTKTAEGSLGSIQETLGRMRELAVQASNGILSDSDRSIIQDEVDQLKRGISDMARNTEFNGIKLLNGSAQGLNTAMNTDGSGRQINIESAALENLGIADFDVTGGFDIADIDKAMEKVSESRSNLGSASNAFQYASSNVRNSVVNLSNARSQIQDADMAEEITNMKKEEILNQYRIYAQKQKEDQFRTELGVMQGFDQRL